LECDWKLVGMVEMVGMVVMVGMVGMAGMVWDGWDGWNGSEDASRCFLDASYREQTNVRLKRLVRK
jgi:hypothetical protein